MWVQRISYPSDLPFPVPNLRSSAYELSPKDRQSQTLLRIGAARLAAKPAGAARRIGDSLAEVRRIGGGRGGPVPLWADSAFRCGSHFDATAIRVDHGTVLGPRARPDRV